MRAARAVGSPALLGAAEAHHDLPERERAFAWRPSPERAFAERSFAERFTERSFATLLR